MGDDAYEVGDAEAAYGAPISCGAIKKGTYVIMKDMKPCRVIDVSASKTGKHGSAKINYVGIDIFTGKRHEACYPSSHTVISPTVTKMDCQVVDIDADGFVELMMSDHTIRSDISAGEMLATLKEKFDKLKDDEYLIATIISALGCNQIIECRTTSTLPGGTF